LFFFFFSIRILPTIAGQLASQLEHHIELLDGSKTHSLIADVPDTIIVLQYTPTNEV